MYIYIIIIRLRLQDIKKGRNFISFAENPRDGKFGPVNVPAGRMVNSTAELIDRVFDCDLSNIEEIASRVIFAPVNDTIDQINQLVCTDCIFKLQKTF